MVGRIAPPRVRPLHPAPGRAVEVLERHLTELGRASDNPGHKLHHRAHGWELEIGYLSRGEKRLMALTARAVRDGSLQSIDAGHIVGPKVLSLLNRLRIEAERDGLELRARGTLQPEHLRTVFEQERQQTLPVGNAKRWAEQEVADFDRALVDFDLLQPDRSLSSANHWLLFHVKDGVSFVRVTPIPGPT